ALTLLLTGCSEQCPHCPLSCPGVSSVSARPVTGAYGRGMDVLGDVLAIARVDAALMATFDARAPWGIELPARPGASLHAVVAGTCWFTVDSADARQLAPGDLVLLPGGVRHELASEPGLPLRRFDEDLKRTLIQPNGDLVL